MCLLTKSVLIRWGKDQTAHQPTGKRNSRPKTKTHISHDLANSMDYSMMTYNRQKPRLTLHLKRYILWHYILFECCDDNYSLTISLMNNQS